MALRNSKINDAKVNAKIATVRQERNIFQRRVI